MERGFVYQIFTKEARGEKTKGVSGFYGSGEDI